MISAQRLALGQFARLLAAAPLLFAGLLSYAMLLSIMAVSLFVVGGVALTVFGPAFGVDSSSSGALSAVLTLSGLISVAVQWRRIRRRADRETATMLAETRPPDDETTVVRPLEHLCQQVDIPTPVVRIRETDQPVCLTVRYRPTQPPSAVLDEKPSDATDQAVRSTHVVVVSTGLLWRLSDRQLQAVLAHEVAHLRNWDLRVTNIIIAPLYSVSIDALNWDRSPLTSLLTSVPITVTRLTVSVAAVIFVRGREFAADHGAATITGEPAALASALELVSGLDTRPAEDLRAAQFLNLLPMGANGWVTRHSHPPTRERVEHLRGMVDH